jgi:hypothetical protein
LTIELFVKLFQDGEMDEEGYPVDQEDMQDDQGGEVEDDPVVIIG